MPVNKHFQRVIHLTGLRCLTFKCIILVRWITSAASTALCTHVRYTELTHHRTGCSQLPTAAQMLWLLTVTSQDCLPFWKHLCLLQWTESEPSTSLSPGYCHILATFALYLLYDLKFTSQYGLDYTCRITSSATWSPSFKPLPLGLCIFIFFLLKNCIINKCRSILKALF